MNKIKMMLMAVATFAVVGGALAFKAAKYNLAFCTSTTSVNPIPTSFTGKTTTLAPSFSYYYTTTLKPTLCHAAIVTSKTFLTNIE